MAKLRVSAEILLHALFPDRELLTLRDIQFDHQRGDAVLELTGHGVPGVDEIVAEIAVERRTTRFVPARRA